MTKAIFILIAISIFGIGTIATSKQDDDQKIEKGTSSFMVKKLDNSRDIVSGLATEDFDQINRAAQDLMLLSHETEWDVLSTPEYLTMSTEFRGSTSRLREAAKDKNIDGATIAFFEVTLNCVRCHKYVRAEQRRNGK